MCREGRGRYGEVGEEEERRREERRIRRGGKGRYSSCIHILYLECG